ncbi:hypothetical protein [Acidicapsa acidisoli]|uniref:hypothetical protein n=1 Tax=Acidicapsa acidisoli TaxID=1615681 RepID=UPI0021DF75F8|nr:hypothetical protein [Acidicapsa acidisoli]
MKERVASFNPEAEAFKIAAYGHLRTLRLEPPSPERMRRLLRLAVGQREERMVAEATAQLMPATRQALDALVNTQIPGSAADVDQMPLFPYAPSLPR